MHSIQRGKHLLAALLLGLGLIGGVTTFTLASPHSLRVAFQAESTPPDATPDDCEDDGEDEDEDDEQVQGSPEAGDDEDDDGEEEDEGDDGEEEDERDDEDEDSEPSDDDADDDEDSEDEADDDESSDDGSGQERSGTPEADDDGECDDDDESGAAGELVEGEDLLDQATITPDEAIAIAQEAASGELGAVELEDEDGTLVYEVEIGNQDVIIDAATGEVLEIEDEDD